MLTTTVHPVHVPGELLEKLAAAGIPPEAIRRALERAGLAALHALLETALNATVSPLIPDPTGGLEK